MRQDLQFGFGQSASAQSPYVALETQASGETPSTTSPDPVTHTLVLMHVASSVMLAM